jgi:acyl-CoA reductase-like NAD-dependent aldehyde dehydrogenase
MLAMFIYWCFQWMKLSVRHVGNVYLLVFSVDEAVSTACAAIFFNMGQVCTAGSRLFVHEDIYDKFISRCVEKAQQRVIGDPFDLATDSGAQVQLLSLDLYMDSNMSVNQS